MYKISKSNKLYNIFILILHSDKVCELITKLIFFAYKKSFIYIRNIVSRFRVKILILYTQSVYFKNKVC